MRSILILLPLFHFTIVTGTRAACSAVNQPNTSRSGFPPVSLIVNYRRSGRRLQQLFSDFPSERRYPWPPGEKLSFPLKMSLPQILRFHGLPLCLSHVEQPVWGFKLSPACSTATLFCPYDRAMSVSGTGFPPPVIVDLLPHGPCS